MSDTQFINNPVFLNNLNVSTVNMLQNLGGKAAITTINGQQVIIRSTNSTGSCNTLIYIHLHDQYK